MFRRILVALALTVAVLLAQPVLLLALQPLRNASIHSIPVLGWVTSSVVNLLPLALTVVLLGVIWFSALRVWKRILFGLPGFRAGLRKYDFQDLDKNERKIVRALYADSRKIVTAAGLQRVDAAGVVWTPSVSGIELIPAGIGMVVGGVPQLPGVEIEKAVNALAAAIPGAEPLEVLPSNDVRYARFVLRTRDPFDGLEGLAFDDELVERGTLDDFLDGGGVDE